MIVILRGRRWVLGGRLDRVDALVYAAGKGNEERGGCSASMTSGQCDGGMDDVSDESNTWPVSYVGEDGIPESL